MERVPIYDTLRKLLGSPPLPLLVAALAGVPATGQETKCKGEIVQHVKDGKQELFKLDAEACTKQKECPDKKNCVPMTKELLRGSKREWCGCPGEKEPPAKCQTVLFHPGAREGQPRNEPPIIDCEGGKCDPGEKWCPVLTRTERQGKGKDQRFVNHYACDCLGGGALIRGACPPLPQPGLP